MNCKKCGAVVDGKQFCSQCGEPVNAVVKPAQPQGNHTQVLVFGILGLALGFATGIVGLIFSILGISKANKYVAQFGDISNQVRIGKRLSIAGLIVSICMIVLFIACVVGIIVLAVNNPEAFKKAAVAIERAAKK